MKRNKEMKLSIALHSAKYILTAIFIALNLLGVVHWYWVWIVSPLLISLAIKVILLLDLHEVDELSDTDRGAGGFGSTGVSL